MSKVYSDRNDYQLQSIPQVLAPRIHTVRLVASPRCSVEQRVSALDGANRELNTTERGGPIRQHDVIMAT